MGTKDTVRAVLDRLPDDCTVDDVLYHLYVIETIGQCLADAEPTRTLTRDDVVERLRERWVPIPEWHLALVEERLAEHQRNPSAVRPVFDMLDEVSLMIEKRNLSTDTSGGGS